MKRAILMGVIMLAAVRSYARTIIIDANGTGDYPTIQAAINDALAHWTFDEGAGDIAHDIVGGYDGIIHGAAWVTGPVGGAMWLDGINDYVELPNNDPAWLPVDDFTLAFWVYFDRKPGSVFCEVLLDLNYVGDGDLGCVVERLSGALVFRFYTNEKTNSWIQSNDILRKGQWYHIVAVREGTTQRLYIDGAPNGSRACSSYPVGYVGSYDDDLVNIGRYTRDTFGPKYFFKGVIDDVWIYDRALSQSEIQHLYAEGEVAGKAAAPDPADGARTVDPNTTLRWTPGLWASDVNGHDMYFGTDFNDVNDANASVPLGVYQGRLDSNTFDPCGLLGVGQWYYWRVDEINEVNTNSPWRGNIWQFRTGTPLIKPSKTEMTFHALLGELDPNDQVFEIRNSGFGTLNWEITHNCDWVMVEPNMGSSNGEANEVVVSVDAQGKDVGVYKCWLTIVDANADNSPKYVCINMWVCDPNECFPCKHPDFPQWVYVGRPASWCNPRQCHGDADGAQEKIGKPWYWVGYNDLNILTTGFGTVYSGDPTVDPWIAADFDHATETIGKGWYHVGYNDLNILVTYFGAAAVEPDCFD